MIDNKTPHLSLPLPHESNLLTDDVPRLREAFASLDAHAAQLETDLVETIAAATDAAKTALWSGVTGKPAAFPPATHGHSFAELSGTPAAFPPATHGHDWTEVGGKPASFPPETHEHNAAYAAKTHNHAASDLAEVIPVAKGGTGRTDGKAVALASSRKISLSGDVAGSANFDGSSNATISVSLKAGAVPSNGMVFYVAAGFPAAPTVTKV